MDYLEEEKCTKSEALIAKSESQIEKAFTNLRTEIEEYEKLNSALYNRVSCVSSQGGEVATKELKNCGGNTEVERTINELSMLVNSENERLQEIINSIEL